MNPNPVVPVGSVLLMWWMAATGDTDLAVVIAVIVALDVIMTYLYYRREIWVLQYERGDLR